MIVNKNEDYVLPVILAKILKRILTTNRATQQGLTKVISKAIKVFKCIAKVCHFSYFLLSFAKYYSTIHAVCQQFLLKKTKISLLKFYVIYCII